MEEKICISKFFVFENVTRKNREWENEIMECFPVKTRFIFQLVYLLQVNFTIIRNPLKGHLASSYVVLASTREGRDSKGSGAEVHLSEEAFPFSRCGYLWIIYSI